MIDCRSMGHLVDRTRRDLSDGEISRICSTYHAWQGRAHAGVYSDISGFCRSCSITEIAEHAYALVPGRYVGFPPLHLDEDALLAVRSEFLTVMDEVVGFASDLELSMARLRMLLNG